MKINYTISTLGYTGGIRTFYEITKRLADRGHTVTITAIEGLRHSTRYSWKARLLKIPKWKEAFNFIIFKKILKDNPYFIFNKQEMLRKLIPDCDINVATDILTAIPVYRSQKGLMFHHHQHDEVLFSSDSHFKILAKESYYLPFIGRVANSIWLKNRLKEKYNIESVLINHAIANEIFYPRKIKKNPHKKRVVSFGKKVEWKGFKDALETMKIVMKKKKNIEWFVYGQNPSIPRDIEAPYNFVHFPSDDELAKLYSSADVVVCPSWYESFPAPPLEAMACGAPLVTTRYGTEDYAFNEKNALVVPPRNPQVMAEAILRILEEKKLSDKFRENGPKTAKQFSWDKTTNKVEKLFLEKLNERK